MTYENPWKDNKHVHEYDRTMQQIDANRMTVATYNDMRNDVPNMGVILHDMAKRYADASSAMGIEPPHDVEAFERVQRDLFAGLYQYRQTETDGGSDLQRKLFGLCKEDDQWDATRQGSQMDELVSALGSAAIAGSVFEAMSDTLLQDEADASNAEHNAQQAEQDAADAQAALEALRHANDIDPGDIADAEAEAAAAQQQAEQARAEANAKCSKANETFGFEQQAMRKAVAMGVAKANKTAKASKAFSFAFGRDGSPVTTEIRRQLLVAGNTDMLRRLAELIGSFIREANDKQSRKAEHESATVVGIEFGNNIERVHADEMALLASEITKPLFMTRFADEALMQYEYEDRESKQRGPIVLCMDTSGSMAGGKLDAAKALAVGLANVAHQQRRDMCVIPFASTSGSPIFFMREATPEEYVQAVQSVLGFGAGGGTCFDSPFKRAMSIIVESGIFEDADIVMLTDGCADLSNDTTAALNTMRQDTGLSVFSLLIGYEGGSAREVLKPVTDRFWQGSEFGLQAAGEVFAHV